MLRSVYTADHEEFRKTVRTFIEREVAPEFDDWYRAGHVPREMNSKLGELGIFGIEVPEEYGGAGIDSYKYNLILNEETALAGVNFGGSHVHVELCLPYLKAYATDEQKRRWLPGFASGDIMFAIAMTELGAGSDLVGMKTTARVSDDGSHYVLNGSKALITGGVHADRVIVCARTAPPTAEDRRHGISLFAVDTTSRGYAVGRKRDKRGLKNTGGSKVSFVDVKVPVEDLLGVEHAGFAQLAENLPRARVTIAMLSYAQARAAVEFARQYAKQRRALGLPVASFQNTRFELAACRADVDAIEAVVDRAMDAHDCGELSAADAASVKLFCTETAARVIDRCLQLHGDYGYMNEYPVARVYSDDRVHRVYGGTSEVMKVIIAKDMGL
ncbi:MAG TPA: acyl-CoA dehydrogenase family protein [Mycobacterium sp.]